MIKFSLRIGDSMKNKTQKKEEQTKKLVSGYIKLGLLFVATIFLVLLLRIWYLTGVNYELNIPIIKETLTQEIHSDEIYNYIRENENSVIYVGVVTDTECREFEKLFNEVIKEKHLENTITYLNLTEEDNIKGFLKEFNKFYDTDLKGYPSIIVFDEGEVKDLLVADKNKLTKENTIEFLDNNDVVSLGY